MWKIPPAILLPVIILSIMEPRVSCLARNCIEEERNALLRFKAGLLGHSNRLSSWNQKNKDCCAWQGVACSNITRHVIKLDLSNKVIDGKRVDSGSLMELKHLTYLDLSRNYFDGINIPPFLRSMKQLQHLNLSYSGFAGIVPHSLGNLSSLLALDLSGNLLSVNDLRWVTNLSSLEYLDMSNVDLSSTSYPFELLNMLTALRVLLMSQCNLNNTHLPHACATNSSMFANVRHLTVSDNWFDGELPCFIQNMPALSFLDLSFNKFNSSETFYLTGLKMLTHLNLSNYLLSYEVEWILELVWDKCRLKSLDLGENSFYGDISRLFRNLSGCWNHNLESLNLGVNTKLQGHLPQELGEFHNLKEFDISYSNISGSIPSSLGNLKSLRSLYLQGNQLSGEIPISLGQLSNLRQIDVSYNSFEGTLSEAHLVKLSKLELLRAVSPMLRFGVGYDWVPPFQLKILTLRSSKIGGNFPKWLQTQKGLTDLDLSKCSIIGTLPKWLHSINLTSLQLSHNNITGPIPELPSTMTSLDLSYNMITHHLPSNIGHMMPLLQNLDLAHNFINGRIPYSLCELRGLQTLDLSNNHLSGNLPDCWTNLHNLETARLSYNELSGVIPKSVGGASSLGWLHLNNNNFTGPLPSTIKNCTSLVLLDVGGNRLSGKLPEWIGKSLLNLIVLRVRDNEFHGTIPLVFCRLLQLQVMDLANNNLVGKIPHCFGNFSSMVRDHSIPYTGGWFDERLRQVMKGVELEYTKNSIYVVNLDLSSNYLVGEIPRELTVLSGLIGLNLANNHLSGEIPTKIGDLESLESLDLSVNNLFGMIPDGLSNLNYLSHLNLSNNNLSGKIPTGRQLQTLDNPLIYEGNPQLCGAPLPKKCPIDEETKAPNVKTHEADGGERDEIWLYGVIIAGFATGFWGVIGVLVVKTKWRQAYFKFIDVAINKMMGY